MKVKTIEDFKNEISILKNEIQELLNNLKLKYTLDEFLNFDSIAYQSLTNIELNIDPEKLKKQDYLILANERYTIEDENFRKIEKKTRSTIFSMKKSKLLKLDEDEVFEALFGYVKLIEYFKRYKILRKDLDNFILLKFPEITTWYLLMNLYGIEFCLDQMTKYKTDEYWGYIEFQNELQEQEKFAFRERSLKLEKKLGKK